MAKNKKEMEALNDENLERASGGVASKKLTRSELEETARKMPFVGGGPNAPHHPDFFKNGFQK